MTKCAGLNTCPVCGTVEPCATIHLRRRHRDGLCFDCVRWIMQRRDALGIGAAAGERQARAELRRAARELDAPDFRSYRGGQRPA